ncbi:hypothetical protein [Nocardioides sp. R-C-SC26]|uniref:hypothetical protein n=1 Tax=Nocardioides sp. R-C-SC26 TaxID=2870414 RepID=UPI001E5A8402|nr:hypothetical protein [Nocardioides sp. R-C-SC26]
MSSAAEVYAVELEPRERGPVKRVLAGAADLATALVGGGLELSAAGDLVVRHRSGAEVGRIPVDGTEEAGSMLTQVRDQMATMSAEEFRATWNLRG